MHLVRCSEGKIWLPAGVPSLLSNPEYSGDDGALILAVRGSECLDCQCGSLHHDRGSVYRRGREGLRIVGREVDRCARRIAAQCHGGITLAALRGRE